MARGASKSDVRQQSDYFNPRTPGAYTPNEMMTRREVLEAKRADFKAKLDAMNPDASTRRAAEFAYTEVKRDGNGFVADHPFIPGGAYTRYIPVGSATLNRFVQEAMDYLAGNPQNVRLEEGDYIRAINERIKVTSKGRYERAKWSIKDYPD